MVLSMVIFPHAHHNHLVRVLWAFGVYVESFSVLPQLRMMQNAKVFPYSLLLPSIFFFFFCFLFYDLRFIKTCWFIDHIYIYSSVLADDRTFHCSLCVCFGDFKIPSFCSLGHSGL